MAILTGRQVQAWPLLQWKFAIKLEQRGLHHSKGSVKAHAARMLGLSPRAKPEVVLAEIEKRLQAFLPQPQEASSG